MKLFCASIALFASCSVLLADEPCLTFIIHAPNTDTQATLQSKKGGQNTAVVLQALAESCVHVNQTVNATTEQEKQQGILNLLSTIFNAAAKLSHKHHKKDGQNISENGTSLEQSQLTLITNQLLDECAREPLKQPLPSTMALINAIPDKTNRETLISVLISTPATRQQYVDDLFTTLLSYIQNNLPNLFTCLKEIIGQRPQPIPPVDNAHQA